MAVSSYVKQCIVTLIFYKITDKVKNVMCIEHRINILKSLLFQTYEDEKIKEVLNMHIIFVGMVYQPATLYKNINILYL